MIFLQVVVCSEIGMCFFFCLFVLGMCYWFNLSGKQNRKTKNMFILL